MERIERALVSVSDKTDLTPFVSGLVNLGIEIISTGGTATYLLEAGIPVIGISEITHFPEMLDGRVKTLHPNVHGGILADRSKPDHIQTLKQHHIQPIDLVVINLYPFVATIQKPGVTLDEAIENIDIGGPAMIRSAAKNHKHVGVITLPSDYESVLRELSANKAVLSPETKRALAIKAFRHTSQYDYEITNYLEKAA